MTRSCFTFISLSWLPRPFIEDVFGDRHRSKDVWPACIEKQMREDLRHLALCQAVVQRAAEMRRELRELPRADHCADRHETSVALRQRRTQPHVVKERIACILDD